MELNTNEEDEVLLGAMAVDEMEAKPVVQRENNPTSGGAQSSQEPPPERKKRPVGLILLAVLILGARSNFSTIFLIGWRILGTFRWWSSCRDRARGQCDIARSTT